MVQGDVVPVSKIDADQHFTEPPPRYSEATLVKKLEELGIGRPSTYASTLSTLRDREYVRVDKNRFYPEDKGRLVTAFLEQFFRKWVEYDFTAALETQLDEVSAGQLDWKVLLREFWSQLKPATAAVLERQGVIDQLDDAIGPFLFTEKPDGADPRLCPACGTGRLHLKASFKMKSSFIGCSNYPECKFTRKFAQPGGEAGERLRIGGVEGAGEADAEQRIDEDRGRGGSAKRLHRAGPSGGGSTGARAPVRRSSTLGGPAPPATPCRSSSRSPTATSRATSTT